MAQPRQLVQARSAQRNGRVERDQRGHQELPADSSGHNVTLGPIENKCRATDGSGPPEMNGGSTSTPDSSVSVLLQ